MDTALQLPETAIPPAKCLMFIDCWQAQHSTHFQDTLRRNSEPLMEEQPQRQQVAMQRHPQVTVEWGEVSYEPHLCTKSEAPESKSPDLAPIEILVKYGKHAHAVALPAFSAAFRGFWFSLKAMCSCVHCFYSGTVNTLQVPAHMRHQQLMSEPSGYASDPGLDSFGGVACLCQSI